jgi:hypothetical protein
VAIPECVCERVEQAVLVFLDQLVKCFGLTGKGFSDKL